MKKLAIAEIEKQIIQLTTEEDPLFKELLADERKGVQQAINRWRKHRLEEKRLQEKFIEMNIFEEKWRTRGCDFIAGVDEVGRGPLAGPVVAAAVILPEGFFLPGIDDSKKLSEKKRDEYAEIIHKEALAIGIGIVESEVIDTINIYEATKKAMAHAISALETEPDCLLIDAMKLDTPYPYEAIIKGDAKSISIAAASIVAKVARDKLMKELSSLYPQYHFEQNMGYGTKDHIQAIYIHGITPYHRKSFAPIKDILS